MLSQTPTRFFRGLCIFDGGKYHGIDDGGNGDSVQVERVRVIAECSTPMISIDRHSIDANADPRYSLCMPTPPIAQLKQALAIAQQIESLQRDLDAMMNWSSSGKQAVNPIPTAKRSGKRTMSPEGRERVAAAQRARWAKSKATSKPVTKATKRVLSPEGRARIVAALKARHAANRKAKN
jgi:hypothetical protein